MYFGFLTILFENTFYVWLAYTYKIRAFLKIIKKITSFYDYSLKIFAWYFNVYKIGTVLKNIIKYIEFVCIAFTV